MSAPMISNLCLWSCFPSRTCTPGSAAGAAALKSSQGPPGPDRPCHSRRPLLLLRRRKGGGAPTVDPRCSQPNRRGTPCFTVFSVRPCSRQKINIRAQDGSRWPNMSTKKGPSWPDKAHFLTNFHFSTATQCCKLQHFCALTSLAGAMQKSRKCCKYQYFFDQRCTKHCKYQCF